MFTLSNGHEVKYVVASGALAYDGLGWRHERPLTAAGIIRPELFTIVTKSLTLKPRAGNLNWWKPWECVRLIPGGSVNKVGLTNPGFEWWMQTVAPYVRKDGLKMVVSLFGSPLEIAKMSQDLNDVPLVGLEYNVSCPNHQSIGSAVEAVKEGKKRTRHSIILKLSADQPYLEILKEVQGNIEAVSWNSVPWEKVFPDNQTPLYKLEQRVGGGGGGVSGKPAQPFNWKAGKEVAIQFPNLPVIGSSIMKFSDMDTVRDHGAKAVSFGCVHLLTPWLPTWMVRKEQKQIKRRS